MNGMLYDYGRSFRQDSGTHPVLREGDSGDEVKLLQQLLKLANFFPGAITGSFDAGTTQLVKDFQSNYNLNSDGIVNEATWEKLYEVARPPQITTFKLTSTRPTLRLGDSGEMVGQLQNQLSHLTYYSGPINQTFDKPTENAVKAFQLNNKLIADGIVENDTWDALYSLYSPLAVCENGTEPPTPEGNYTVASGDTLYSIAKMFNTTVDALKQLNNLSSNLLKIGQVLKVPNGEVVTPPETEEIVYYVKSGDTLYSIARLYNTTVDAIKRLNNLTSDMLRIGQKLIISKESLPSTPSETTYIVKSGDTLYRIANTFNTTVNDIMKRNNLTNTTLSIGQKLKIPAATGSNYTTYTVKSGDSLYSIASSFSTTVDRIKSLNNLTSNLILPGQQLLIPKS